MALWIHPSNKMQMHVVNFLPCDEVMTHHAVILTKTFKITIFIPMYDIFLMI